FLAKPGEATQVPARAGKGTLRILAVDAENGQAIALQVHLCAHDGLIHAQARVNRWQGDRNAVLLVGAAKALESPAFDRNIAVERNPLGIDDAAQPVIARDVVPPCDRLVGCSPQRTGQRPIRVKLEPAITLEISAKAMLVVGGEIRGVGVGYFAVGDEGSQL